MLETFLKWFVIIASIELILAFVLVGVLSYMGGV